MVKIGRKQKNKVIKKVFVDDVYRFSWMVIVGGELQEAIDYFALRIQEESYKHEKKPDAHFAAFRPKKCGLLWFKDDKIFPEFLAHECFHGTMYLFECLDMKGPVEETEEVFAYYLQWLVERVRKCV